VDLPGLPEQLKVTPSTAKAMLEAPKLKPKHDL
jgi:hypothetical protein